MKVIRYPQYQSLWRNSCVTVGNFDGVHIGHQALISTMVKQAKKMNNLAVVVTMQPLPIQLFNGSNA
ncbi:MAG: adenylyltransferase/cytidyltransferase family protein, partial [Marinicella sp.]